MGEPFSETLLFHRSAPPASKRRTTAEKKWVEQASQQQSQGHMIFICAPQQQSVQGQQTFRVPQAGLFAKCSCAELTTQFEKKQQKNRES